MWARGCDRACQVISVLAAFVNLFLLKKIGPRFDSPFLDLIYLGTRLRSIYLFLKLDEITMNLLCGISVMAASAVSPLASPF